MNQIKKYNILLFILFLIILNSLIVTSCSSAKNESTNNDQEVPFTSYTIKKDTSLVIMIGMLGNDTLNVQINNSDIFQSDGFFKEDSLFILTKIYLNDSVIYLEDKFLLIEFKANSISYISIDELNGYILFHERDPLAKKKLCIFQVTDNEITKRYALATFFGDIDNDGFVEVGGFPLIEGYCQSCDSAFYTPAFIYELNTEFFLDSNLSRIITETRYYEFLGFHAIHNPVPIKK